jgi:hypothetical protein
MPSEAPGAGPFILKPHSPDHQRTKDASPQVGFDPPAVQPKHLGHYWTITRR